MSSFKRFQALSKKVDMDRSIELTKISKILKTLDKVDYPKKSRKLLKSLSRTKLKLDNIKI